MAVPPMQPNRDNTGCRNVEFLDSSQHNAYGPGGAMMLDDDRFSPTWDMDVKPHNPYRHLQSVGGTSTSVGGNVEAEKPRPLQAQPGTFI